MITTPPGFHASQTISFEVAGKTMTFETGKIGRQASGSVTARMGDTIVYTTVCYERDATPVDFTPLRVDYFARYRYSSLICCIRKYPNPRMGKFFKLQVF